MFNGLHIFNQGPGIIKAYTAAMPDAEPSTGGQTINVGIDINIRLTDLGDYANHNYVILKNMSTLQQATATANGVLMLIP
jgi:hypothetical protein